ncbi:hypothetical protein ACRPK8_02965 [Exiguobacterium sp. TDN 0502]|uniref:hypothetical protein n=1 Tax=Exiguobacterium sp. TDN 0502 TaxID=3420731 RepID=UPI003D7733A0
MTNELIEVENHYLMLSHLLLRHMASEHPELAEELKQVLQQIELLSVFEKTAFIGSFLMALENQDGIKRMHQIELILKEENISENTFGVLKKYNQWIK